MKGGATGGGHAQVQEVPAQLVNDARDVLNLSAKVIEICDVLPISQIISGRCIRYDALWLENESDTLVLERLSR